jgi:hypothetical protein
VRIAELCSGLNTRTDELRLLTLSLFKPDEPNPDIDKNSLGSPGSWVDTRSYLKKRNLSK